MTKHTPGPWHVDPNFRRDVNREDDNAPVCTCEVNDPDVLVSTQRANAVLIAAAPELLDFAKTVCGLHRHAKPDDIQRIIGQAQQLVAKARGRETGG